MDKELLREIDKEFDVLYKKNSVLLENGFDQVVTNTICENITAVLTGRSKTLLDKLLNKRQEEYLARPPFSGSAANSNKLYALNLNYELKKKYSFEQKPNLTPIEAQSMLQKLFPSLAVTMGGGILSLSVHSNVAKAITIPVSLVIAAAMYVFYDGVLKKKNAQNAREQLRQCLDNLKRDLLDWMEEINQVYEQRVDELAVAL